MDAPAIVDDAAFTPRLFLKLTKKHVAHLKKQSARHYDATCRAAGQQGGLIYGWNNALNEFELKTVSGNFRDIDLCCKILETPGSDDKLSKQLHDCLSYISYLHEAAYKHLSPKREAQQ